MDIETIKKVYNRYTPIYNIAFNSCLQPGRKLATQFINTNLPSGAKILEVGVGTGLSLPFYNSQLEITGIDVAADMLSKAQLLVKNKRLHHVKALLEMNAEFLKFPDHSFDAVVAMYVVSVVPDLERFIDEITRVCKPGGDIIFVNHFQSNNKLARAIEKKLSKLHRFLGFHTDLSLQRLLNHAKLQLNKYQKINLFGYWTLVHCKNIMGNDSH